ncbi:MAG TPA: GyrI-like domain-containing protein [Beijerinckiaceae bacterium]|nr:GyrI-like domain-containing protein [Beijerinckiaceae bacterium]
MKRGLMILGIVAVGLAFGVNETPAQGTGTSRPGAVESSPLAPPAAPPAPGQPPAGRGDTLTQDPGPPAPPGPQVPAPFAGGRPTLVPKAGDPLDVDEVVLPSKPTAMMAGVSTWTEGFADLKKTLERIEDELRKAGIAPAGRPLTVFTETDDSGFHYEAMVPVEQVPQGRTSLTAEIRFSRTPEGKAYRFVHKGPYEEIDETYDTISTYLDAKGIIAKDAFLEEYVTDLVDPQDDNTEVNIFVQPR